MVFTLKERFKQKKHNTTLHFHFHFCSVRIALALHSLQKLLTFPQVSVQSTQCVQKYDL